MQRWAIIAALAAALLAGCGSYTKHDFALRADAICVGTVRASRSLEPPAFTGSTGERLRSLSAYLNRQLPLLQAEERQIRRLPRPSQSARDGARLRAYLAGLRESTTEFRALAAAAGAGDPAAVSAAEQLLAASPVVARALAYGLRACATPGATYR